MEKFDPTAFLNEEPPAYQTVVPFALYSTYILVNPLERVYVGMTANLSKRIAQHRAGTCITSAKLGDLRFKVLHVYAGLNYMMSSKLERYLHKVQKQGGDEAVLRVVAHSPAFAGALRDAVALLPTTPMERQRMTRDVDCGRCGRPLSSCTCDFGV